MLCNWIASRGSMEIEIKWLIAYKVNVANKQIAEKEIKFWINIRTLPELEQNIRGTKNENKNKNMNLKVKRKK